MTDREMLELCLEAFWAVPKAETSKRFLQRNQIDRSVHVPYVGTWSYKLAMAMHRMLRQHLGIKED